MRPVLLYDADCGFCAKSAGWFEPLRCRVHVTPLQSADLGALGITEAAALAEVHLVAADGSIQTGHHAIATALATSGSLPIRSLGRVLGSRALDRLGRAAYSLLAKNRYRLPGGTAQCRT